MNYTFKSPDHPEAIGNEPREGDEEYVFRHPTDEGGTVFIRCGRQGLVNFTAVILAAIQDDPNLLEQAQAKMVSE